MKHTPPPPHPFGEDRQARLDLWESIAAFGEDRQAPLVQIAKLAIHAAEAGTDKEMARRALYALGLHGTKKADGNEQLLRDALDEFCRAYDAAYPQPDDDTDEAPNVDADALERLKVLCAEGLEKWLYKQVKGNGHVDTPTRLQFLKRNAVAGGVDMARNLEWALRAAKPLTPPNLHSRGRAGS